MDTPDKKIQPSPSSLFSKFEDSPVFNYLSTLSPIRTFNFNSSAQSFHLFNFASPPSALTSPLNNCSKDSKITRAILLPDEPKSNNSQNRIEDRSAGTLNAAEHSDVHSEEVGNFGSGGEANVSTSAEALKLVIELPKSLKYDSGSPENRILLSDSVKTETESNVAGTEISSTEPVQSVTKDADRSFENEMCKQRIQVEQNKEVCDWEKFIDEASDILSCGTPSKEKHQEEPDEKCVDSGTLSFVAAVLQSPNDFDDAKKIDSVCPPIFSENHDMDTPLNKSGTAKTNEANLISAVKSCAVLTEEVVNYSSTEQDDKQQKMTRRRCLVYEMSGTHYRKLLDSSPISKPPVSPNTSKEKCLVANKPGSNKFSSLLPGIGLHLNAIAATAKNKIIVKRQTLTCRRQLISSPRTITSMDLPSSDTKSFNIPIVPSLAGGDSNEQKDEVVEAIQNSCQSSVFGEGIEFPPSSPKKKRRKPENGGDDDSCKRCNCKRSKCLKLYCECFAAGLYCVDSCNCQDCLNKPIHEETVLETRRQIESRNPLAFAPKVIRCSTTAHNGDEPKKTPASARHKRGCNCKKSGCLKKYCECFQGGVGCSLSCRCEGCKNTFGQKEGPEDIAIFREAQIEPEQSSINGSSYHGTSETDVEHQGEVPPESSKQQDQANAKPLKQVRQPLRQPFLFNGVTPQFPSIENPPPLQPCENRVTENPDESDFIEDLKVAPEDETPEVLKGDYLLSPCVKSASPNCKRVSSPHCHDFETSPGWRSCRKLILRSIPSFPTLTPEKKKQKASREPPMNQM